MLKVATEHCGNSAKFLLKIDDDMLVNTEKLIQLLSKMEDAKNILMGKLFCGSRPVRSPHSKWYIFLSLSLYII